jgi:hypothetical protein
MLTSEIFEMQQAYGETGYFDGILAEFINDVIPQLDTNQLIRLRKAAWDQYQELTNRTDVNQKDLPF